MSEMLNCVLHNIIHDEMALPPLPTLYGEILAQTLQERPTLALRGDEPGFGELLRLIHLHFMGPFFLRTFREQGFLQQLAPELEKQVKHEEYHLLRLHALNEHYLFKLVKDFRALNLEPVPLKGWWLAHRLYEIPEERYFSDIDLLFPPGKESQVDDYFRSQGFEPNRETLKFAANKWKREYFLPSEPLLKVECHFSLGYGPFMFKDCWDGLARETVKLSTGATETLLKLSALDEYLFLVFHGGVQHRYQRLVWLLDLARFERCEPLDWQQLEIKAKKLNLTPALKGTRYFLSRFGGLPPSVKANPLLDEWFAKIVRFEIETSLRNRFGVRSLFYPNGMLGSLKYAFQHRCAKLFDSPSV